MPTSRIPALDGLRGIAILAVLAGHYARQDLDAMQGFAGVGVDLFFALSGFLIAGLLLAEQDRTGTIRLSRFYWRRACRILPAFALWAVITYAITAPHRQPQDPGTLTALFTYTVNYWQIFTAPTQIPIDVYRWPFHELTVHAWSLAVEEQFYLLLPVCLLLLKHDRAIRAMITIIGVVALWRAILVIVLQVNAV